MEHFLLFSQQNKLPFIPGRTQLVAASPLVSPSSVVQQSSVFLSYRSSPSLVPCGMSSCSLSVPVCATACGKPQRSSSWSCSKAQGSFWAGRSRLWQHDAWWLICCRACDAICQVSEGASLPPPTGREHLESEPVWKQGRATTECSQMTPDMVLFLSNIFPMQTPIFQALALSKGVSGCS